MSWGSRRHGLVMLLISTSALAADPFPGDLPGISIGSGLNASFEPSGSAWHPRLQQLLLCSDSGRLALLSPDGASVMQWSLSGNWEGIAVANPAGDTVFVVNENTAHIREFNIVTGSAGRDFALTSATAGPGVLPLTSADIDALTDKSDGNGAESLTFVPDVADTEGGVFWVGSQENGNIYTFRLSLSASNAVVYLGKFKHWAYNDLQGLDYDWTGSSTVVGIFGGSNRWMQLSRAGQLMHEWSSPAPTATGEEGVAYNGTFLFIAHDPAQAHEVWRYSGVVLIADEIFSEGFDPAGP